MNIAYIRVSSKDQNEERQVAKMKEFKSLKGVTFQ